ncbi:MAG: extracellular solute-binding protein [Lachnoclostridium sp.]|nr:extracellular solute-binding protein [Lachnospira sp.]MCM1248269.1 extracellular solute-binding protein [Lachnoclostridium sp.]
MKRIVWMFLIISILLCSCGKQEKSDWTVQEKVEKGWVVSDSISIPDDVNTKGIVCKQDAMFYMSDNAENDLLNMIPYENTSGATAVILERPDIEHSADCYLMAAYDSGMDHNDYLTLWRLGSGTDGKEHYKLVLYNKQGLILENIDMDAWEMQEEIKNIQKAVKKDEIYYFLAEKKLIIVDGQQRVKRTNLPSERCDILLTGDTILLVEYKASEIFLYEISGGAIGDCLYKIPVANATALFMDGKGKVWISAADRLYRCDIEEYSMDLVLEWSAVGLRNSSIQNIVSVSDDVIIVYGYEENICTIWKLSATDIVDQRTVITLMTNNEFGGFVADWVYGFNALNEEYRVVLYNPAAGLTGEDAQTKRQLLLTSSNPPDLVDIYSMKRWEAYAENGMFEDLSSYIQNSEALEEEDYVPNILEGGKIGEQQIFIPYSFIFTTLYGQEKYVGGESGWTLQELLDKCHQNEEISVLNSKSEGALEFLLTYSMEEFIDYSRGECNFEVPLFYDLLQCVAKAQYTEPDFSQGATVLTVFNNNVVGKRAVLDSAILCNMESYLAYTYMGMMKEDVTDSIIKLVLKGYPSKDGKMCANASFLPNTCFAICSNSDNKEGAWQFIEYCQSCKDDFIMGFPAKKEWLAENLQTLRLEEFMGVELEEPTKEDVEELLSIIGSLKFISGQDEVIMQMITEEAQGYFEGQKSEEEVAQIIQRRIQLYLWENFDVIKN